MTHLCFFYSCPALTILFKTCIWKIRPYLKKFDYYNSERFKNEPLCWTCKVWTKGDIIKYAHMWRHVYVHHTILKMCMIEWFIIGIITIITICMFMLELKGLQEKLCFFIIHFNPTFANKSLQEIFKALNAMLVYSYSIGWIISVQPMAAQ